jgi:signal transduction histidine kinase
MEPLLEELAHRTGDAEEHGRVDAILQGLKKEPGPEESLAEVAHDARNMVAALSLYCEMLEEPGVLAFPFAHYCSELRLVTAASRRLVERLMALHTVPTKGSRLRADCAPAPEKWSAQNPGGAGRQASAEADSMVQVPVANLAEELLANRNLLSALAGPAITVTVQADGGAKPVRITGEDLTRVLVNLVKNAAEAMPNGGRIRIMLSERPGRAGNATRLLVVVEDDGPGIPQRFQEKVFDRGYTTHAVKSGTEGGWPSVHRGLGLTISRSIAEAAGGRLVAVRCGGPGARLEMELPVQGAGAVPEIPGIAGFVVS